ncbi:MAG TPA: class I SAM-dependent methyltransferase [Terriglobales bacterium]|nr:class I SAM-dependent methyltransferase [Terriglobales bacterium]
MSEGRLSLWCDELRSARYEKYEHPDRFDRDVLLLRHVGSGKNVLELGCSTGYITRLLLQQNCVVTAIENDPDAAQKAAKTGAAVLTRDLNNADWSRDLKPEFDVVLMGDVLEHLVNPYKVLLQARPLVCGGGYAVICLPNVAHWLIRLQIALGQFNYQPTGTLDATHLRFFTVHSARQLIEAAGYRLLKFDPVIGGRMSGHFRPAWQVLARLRPGLFAYQLLMSAAPCP